MEKVIQGKPNWLKAKIGSGPEFNKVRNLLHEQGLHTVCEEALCPNIGECWACGTAAFMVLGRICTRKCSFCAVQSARKGEQLDMAEPEKIADAVKRLGLRYAVLTSVDRDDLPDFGALHFAGCIRAVKAAGAKVEALIPDFQGNAECLQTIAGACPDVIGHNIEVVRRLQPVARDGRASYELSLGVLQKAKELGKGIFTKSSIMLGLGESMEEVAQAMDDLLAVQCDFLTVGQYLQPIKHCLPVQRFAWPEEFAELKRIALEKGFKGVEAGPLVRSSYRAAGFWSDCTGGIANCNA